MRLFIVEVTAKLYVWAQDEDDAEEVVQYLSPTDLSDVMDSAFTIANEIKREKVSDEDFKTYTPYASLGAEAPDNLRIAFEWMEEEDKEAQRKAEEAAHPKLDLGIV